VEEGIGCQTKKDFYFRFTIAYKEARESYYWLKVLKESKNFTGIAGVPMKLSTNP
jgi:four helix bundle protein